MAGARTSSLTCAGNSLNREVLGGRCKESDTCQTTVQAQCFVGVAAKTLAGVSHLKDCILCGRHRRARLLRRVALLELELEDDLAWPVLDFR